MLRTALTSLVLCALLPAQDVRELSTPTGHLTLTNVTTTTIGNTINAGYRLVDIEYRGIVFGTSTFTAVFVENSGAYSATWWWYTGITSTQLSSFLATNQARLIDLEPYQDAGGNLRFACIMVDNTGSNNKAWWYYFGTTTTFINSQLGVHGARLVDLDDYDFSGSIFYSAVMIANTGADNRAWWWYLNQTPAQIGSLLTTNQAQLYDLEPRSNGNWDCVMVQNPSAPIWYWWYGLTTTDISYLTGQYGVRVIDVESYLVGGATRYAIVALNNSNALTTAVGNAMRARTDGQVGCWLQRINGPNLAALNGTTQFEPASTMKTLHHVHAMKQVASGLSLNTNLTVYSGYSGTCPQNTGPFLQPLQGVLQDMMENSDNAATQAVAAHFTPNAINLTAQALIMTGTSLNHVLGCGGPTPNQITLADLHALHTEVANGYLGAMRGMFYQLMLDSVNDLTIASMINSEGATLGLSAATLASFRNFTDVAHKGGSYDLSGVYHRAEFGYLSLPFIVNDVITPREYGFGAFVNNGSVAANANAAVWTDAIPLMLRPQIRAALQSWTNSLAGVTSLGSGCGGLTQTVTGLPRLGTTVTYDAVNGYANAIALFGIGFSSTSWNGVPLPASLVPFGAGAGCFALNDIVISSAAGANSLGHASFPVALPSQTSGIGFTYYSQMYSFGPATFLTSNGQRSIVGL